MGHFYLFVHRQWSRLLRFLDIGFTGFWLGILNRKQFHAVDELMYQRSGTYQSREHNLRGLFPWEEEAIGAYFQNSQRLMVIGAGGGREVLVLAQRGFEVLGFECNPALTSFASDFLAEQKSSGRIESLPRDATPPPGSIYDGIIIGWATYMLIAGRENRIRFLHELNAQLPPEAPILLSFFTREGSVSRYTSIARLANLIRAITFRSRIEIGDDLAPNYIHRFIETEIEQELKAAGFHLVQYRPQLPGPYEPGWAIGLKQNGANS